MKARLFLILSALAVVACLTTSTYAQTPAPQAPATDGQSVMTKAEDLYKRGEALLKDGKAAEAGQSFDAAVESLLSAPADIRGLATVQAYYFDLVNRIQLLQVGATVAQAQDAATPSPLDELSRIDLNKEKVRAGIKIDPALFDFKFTVTPEVERFIDFYANGRGRGTMERGLIRSGRYREMAERVFAEEGVPLDLIWLAQVESVWQPSALSWAAAKGIWQFIPGTGARFGLQQNSWVDERSHPEKATRAAAKYLKFLNNYFAGDWLLAMAAYNSGENGVDRAIMRCGYADFWELHQRNLLPNETRNYVPAILAVIAIAKNQQQFGFNVTPEPALKYDTYRLDASTTLAAAADLLDISPEDLKSLNPELRRGVTPPSGYELKLPVGTRERFALAYQALPEEKRMSRPTTVADDDEPARSVVRNASYRTVLVSYRVRRGDTLAGVAERHGVSISDIAGQNRLSTRAELRAGQVLSVPVKQSDSKFSTRTVSSKHAAKHPTTRHHRR